MKFLAKNEAESIKDLVHKELGSFIYAQDNGNVTDITDIATKLGFLVYGLNFDNDDDLGAIIIDKKKDIKLIAVNNDNSLTRKRFTIAHEIAHYFLEKANQNPLVLFRHRETHSESESTEELKADYFAAYTLIPEKRFLDYLKNVHGIDSYDSENIERLKGFVASEFNVSVKVAKAYLESRLYAG